MKEMIITGITDECPNCKSFEVHIYNEDRLDEYVKCDNCSFIGEKVGADPDNDCNSVLWDEES